MSSLTVVIVFIIAKLVRERLRSSLLLFALFVSMLYAYLYIYYYTCALYILLGVMWSDLPKEILHKGGAGVEANTGACYQCDLHH